MKKTLILSLVFFSCLSTQAQWTTNTLNNTPVCTYTDDDTNPVSISDGAGGSIVVWEDRRSLAYDIYAQKMDANGVAQWTANGIGVCTTGFDQLEPNAFPDGSGGAFIVWTDERFSSNDWIYAQHINSSGSALWASNGIKVSARSGCSAFDAIADGAGGFIISYFYSNSISSKIYTQRIDSQGIAQWASSDLVVCNTLGQFSAPYPKMTTDGSGGMIITWLDDRTPTNNADVYAQHINASGQIQWTANGVGVNTGTLDGENLYIVSDNTGGAIIAWNVLSNIPPQGIYAQRINSAGIIQWPTEGVTVSTTISYNARLLADGTNGALVYWNDDRFYNDPSPTSRVYTQKLDSQGAILWPVNGISLNNIANYTQYNPYAYVNGDGNFYFAYTQVSNTSVSGYNMLYLQKMAPNGNFLWTGNGVGVGTNGNYEHDSPTIVPDNYGGMIVAFSKDAAIYEGNIYVQNVHADGTVGPNLSNISFDENETIKMYPNPTQGLFMVESTSIIDTITISDLLGKEVLSVSTNSLNASIPFQASKGVYFVKLRSGTKETVKKLLVN